MSGFGPRTYLVGCILPELLQDYILSGHEERAEKLDEAICKALYIADLTLTHMSKQTTHDFEKADAPSRIEKR